MANTILTPDIIAREALMVLRNNAVMARLVHRDYDKEFVAKVGDTITIRKPASFEAKEFTSTISVQDGTEGSVTLKMDKFLDVSFKVTSKDLTLSIDDFSKQFLVPAMQAFNDKIDSYLISLCDSATASNYSKVVTSGTNTPYEDMVDARQGLTTGKAPLTDRHYVFNSSIEAALLKDTRVVDADKVGDNGTALREASLGRRAGMDLYVDQNMDSATNAKGVVFHKNAMALVTRPLQLPLGTDKAAYVDYDGFSLRVVYGYDQNTKTDTVSIDMLCGVVVLDKDLIAQVK